MYGYKVILADVPEAAIEIAKNRKKKIDLLITDMVMPNINGLELAERFLEYRPGVKVIYMSGYPQKSSVMSDSINLNGEYHPFIAKPFSPEQFVRIVRQVLDTEAEPLL